jgi:hypothetical protein
MPTGHFAASQLVTVAAFAVCIRPRCHPIVSKLPSDAIWSVCAWLIASRKERRTKYGSFDPCLKRLCLIRLLAVSIETSLLILLPKSRKIKMYYQQRFCHRLYELLDFAPQALFS